MSTELTVALIGALATLGAAVIGVMWDVQLCESSSWESPIFP
jgi:hypothetical protein